ncbi:hypothetical protein [Lacticaseibacillus nasuensis]|uniref:Uncharacterized protein n=1 Tax=Lacticaseibacillus nasuensis JCM 17158 TaxID=1291734 RepID=A0A0R1JIF3_9LACO|nr:hypothetical protein [Lacticaseibacillus nasuensis]KRK71071.1 hypothetical protein FD02_GL000256 [Lacticaseibacillus nasuensis JCM 17158]
MHYELLNTLAPTAAIFPVVQARAQAVHATLITLAATPNYGGLLQQVGLPGVNLLDRATGREYHADQYRFFNRVRVPSLAKIDMNENGSISVLHQGADIGREYLFPNTRRAAQDVRFTNPDGSLDYIEEYASDGSVFSNLFYTKGDMQEMAFFNADEQVVVRYFLYQGAVNLITLEDPQTHAVTARYDTLNAFLAAQLAALVTPQDTVTINYLGIELSVLVGSQSHNRLVLSEPPLTDDGAVRGNLAAVLTDTIDYVQEVVMSPAAAATLKNAGMPMTKVTVHAE